MREGRGVRAAWRGVAGGARRSHDLVYLDLSVLVEVPPGEEVRDELLQAEQAAAEAGAQAGEEEDAEERRRERVHPRGAPLDVVAAQVRVDPPAVRHLRCVSVRREGQVRGEGREGVAGEGWRGWRGWKEAAREIRWGCACC